MSEVEPRDEAADLQHRLQRHGMYVDYSKEMRALQASNFESLDRAILTLSSALLGLSLAFIRELGTGDPEFLTGLISSWVSFGAAILFTLGSLVASQQAAGKMIDQAERYYLHDDDDALDDEPPELAWTRRLNGASLATFALGIVLTIVFVALNV